MTERDLDIDHDADLGEAPDIGLFGGDPPAAPRSGGAHRHRKPGRSKRDGRSDERPGRGRGDDAGKLRSARGRRGRTVAALLVVLVMLGGLGGGIWYGGSRLLGALGNTPDYSGSGSGSVTVLIMPGDTASDVARTLSQAGVVKSPKAFVAVAENDSRSTTLQPGTYRLRRHMKASAALDLLFDPASRLRARIAIPEGFSVAQTLARVAASTGLPPAEVGAAAKDSVNLGLPSYAKGRLEGFLYPATYDFEPGTPALRILQTMVAKFTAVAASSQLEQRAAALKMTPYQIIIVASLVQEEGRVSSDMPKISRVIYNRLAAGTPLGIDAAILYGLGRTGGKLSEAELAKATPYNSRLLKGLPPTPIDSPGQTAVNSALAPAPGNWIYYVIKDKQGHHLFTADYDAFVAQKARSRAAGLL